MFKKATWQLGRALTNSSQLVVRAINKKRVVFLRLNSNSGDREEDLLHKKDLKRPQLIILRYDINAFFNCTNFAHCRPQLYVY